MIYLVAVLIVIVVFVVVLSNAKVKEETEKYSRLKSLYDSLTDNYKLLVNEKKIKEEKQKETEQKIDNVLNGGIDSAIDVLRHD